MIDPAIKLVLADVNETILRVDENLPSPETVEVVTEMYSAGIDVVPITSLSAPLIRGFAQSLSLRGPGVLDGGATYYDFELERPIEQYSRWLEPGTTREIVDEISYLCTEIYYDEASTKRTPNTVDIDAIEEPTPSVFAVYPSIVSTAVREGLHWVKGVSAQYNRHDGQDTMQCAQVTCEGVDKASGVRILLESEKYQGLSGEQIAVIADGEPDKAYFDVMPPGTLKIAMGNGALKDLIKDELGVVEAPHVNDNGFVWAMRKYVLRNA